ncbi:hypothetical protein ACA910_012891 [Epithemia clementina (nom. ined.)]
MWFFVNYFLFIISGQALNVGKLHRYRAQPLASPWNSVASTARDLHASVASSSEPVFLSEKVAPSKTKVALLICPAQFCVPSDYDILIKNLMEIESDLPVKLASRSSITVPLSRTDWIKVARQLPTRAFLEARLDVKKTLQWYFEAIEKGLSQIFAAEGEDVNVCFVGHSIGGWVARAYLGGLSQSSSAVHRLALKQCSSLITLGTPHISPETALVDQTRGLLRAIAESRACSPQALQADHGIAITCVCSTGIQGLMSSSNSTSRLNFLEPIIATGSYLPLTGRWALNDESGESMAGDGIVPSSLSFLESPADRVLLEKCLRTGEAIRHSHVVPTPWNLWDGLSPSIKLPEDDFPSYVSKGVVEQWAKFIQ